MSELQALFDRYVSPLPMMPDIFELCNALKESCSRINARIDYNEDKKRRWQALRERANPPGRVEWPLAPPDEMVQLRRAQAATGKLINEYESEKASREDYILELRAKLKRAGQHGQSRSVDVDMLMANAAHWEHQCDLALEMRADDCVARARDIAEGKRAVRELRGVQEELAIAQANAQSLERGLPAAVDAATAQLRAELAECRKYVCELIRARDEATEQAAVSALELEQIESDFADTCDRYRKLVETLGNVCTDRDAAKKERDEAVATLDFANARIGGAKKAEQCMGQQLAAAQEQLASARPPSAVLEENENLRRLSSEACAERENLRAELVEAKDRLAESQRARNDALAQQKWAAGKLQTLAIERVHIDEWLSNWERGVTRARDVVKELCRLRGIRT